MPEIVLAALIRPAPLMRTSPLMVLALTSPLMSVILTLPEIESMEIARAGRGGDVVGDADIDVAAVVAASLVAARVARPHVGAAAALGDLDLDQLQQLTSRH